MGLKTFFRRVFGIKKRELKSGDFNSVYRQQNDENEEKEIRQRRVNHLGVVMGDLYPDLTACQVESSPYDMTYRYAFLIAYMYDK